MKKIYILLGLLGLLFCGYTVMIDSLPTEKSNLFTGSGNCTLCHSGSGNVLINADGRDVSPIYHWQSSMMGNSAKDPYWQAKVSSEVEINPHLQEIIEDKCATCHAPMGRTEAIYNGKTSYTFDEIKQDPLSLDGVSCSVCHQIDPDNLGTSQSFSGNYIVKPVKKIYGPYENPFTVSMVNNTGYTPVQGTHIESSQLCATCHTLITPYVDSEGNVAGYFPEQMPYYEWLNSSYPSQEMTCQKCHMPQVNEELKIASLPANLQNKRKPIFEHHFVGGNTIINKMMKDNYEELGIESIKENLDTTSHYALKNLMENSMEISTSMKFENSFAIIDVTIQNKTGHKLPTGFPSRRIWIHLVVTNNSGDTIFESGKYNKEGIILSKKSFEAHHDTISDGQNVQIYETILGNTQNEITTTLLEASQYLKDNRIPPKGFSITQPYDSLIAIKGHALNDFNFNKNIDGVHGSGSDKITYAFPFSDITLNYQVEICYQSIKPNYSNHLSESLTNESKLFSQMYTYASKFEIISSIEESAIITNFNTTSDLGFKIFPIPTNGYLYIEGIEKWPIYYSVYSIKGKLLEKGKSNSPSIYFNNLSKGTYILRVKSNHKEKSFKLIHD